MIYIAKGTYTIARFNLIGNNFVKSPMDVSCYLSPPFSSPNDSNIKFQIELNPYKRSIYLKLFGETVGKKDVKLKIKFKFTVKHGRQYNPYWYPDIEKIIDGECQLPVSTTNKNIRRLGGEYNDIAVDDIDVIKKENLHLGWDNCYSFKDNAIRTVTFEVQYTKMNRPLDHPQLVCANLEAIRKRSQFSDVILFSSDGHQFEAHKVILSAQSAVLCTMFSSDKFKENKTNQVKFKNISKNVMEVLLRYIYSGDTTQVKQYAVELLEVAHEYDIKALVDECVRSMLTNIYVDNAAKLLYYSDLYELKELKAKVMDFICGASKEVIKSEGWKVYVKVKPDLIEQLHAKFLDSPIEGMSRPESPIGETPKSRTKDRLYENFKWMRSAGSTYSWFFLLNNSTI